MGKPKTKIALKLKKKKKGSNSRKNNQFRSKNTTSNQSSGLGTWITRGIRALVSVLPGSKFLAPLADFVLTQAGMASSIKVSQVDNVNTVASGELYGLYSKLVISRANIVGSCPTVTKQLGGNGETYFYHEYQDCRVDELCIVVQPDSTLEKRSGMLYIGFTPFENSAQSVTDLQDKTPVSKEMVKRCLANKFGTYGAPLVLHYRPKAYDGLAYAFAPINTTKKVSWDAHLVNYYDPEPYGILYIYYENLNRDESGQFKAHEFAANVSMSSKMAFRRPIPQSNITFGSDVQFQTAHLDKIRNIFDGVSVSLIDASARKTYLFTNATVESSNPRKDGDSVIISGTVNIIKQKNVALDLQSLESLAID